MRRWPGCHRGVARRERYPSQSLAGPRQDAEDRGWNAARGALTVERRGAPGARTRRRPSHGWGSSLGSEEGTDARSPLVFIMGRPAYWDGGPSLFGIAPGDRCLSGGLAGFSGMGDRRELPGSGHWRGGAMVARP